MHESIPFFLKMFHLPKNVDYLTIYQLIKIEDSSIDTINKQAYPGC